MKKLLLLRHAKSSWDDPALRDFERPLNKRGTKDAPRIGKYIAKRKIKPDLVISSPAERARQTTALVAKAAKIKSEVRYDKRIYEASTEQLLGILGEIEDGVNEVLLVGHNYGIEDLVELLTGEVHHMPTAALALITLDTDNWESISRRTNRLEWLVKPKELA